MSLFKEAPSGKSVAAFLFMPQLRLMMPQFIMGRGIFANLLAVMMVQAGLLPQGHPATNPSRAARHRLRDLIGEAWFILRTSPNPTRYQYAMFSSILLMMAFLVLAVVMMVVHIFYSSGIAQAAVPVGPLFSDPTPGPPGDPNTADLAEQMLNNVLVLGSLGEGSPMQKALGPLLAMYSWGALVVGAFMVFWAVISIVAETARTGQLGGNRHNMLWAPIRLVFAIGLLVPLGFGFNSGQYIVIKIAQWGSNLGTRGWVGYVDSIVNDKDLLATAVPKSPIKEIHALLQMEICRQSYNQQLEAYKVLGGGSDYRITSSERREEGSSQDIISYGNNVDATLCGTMKFQSEYDPDLAAEKSLTKDAMKTLRKAQYIAFAYAQAELEKVAEKIVAKQLPYKGEWDGPFPEITVIQPIIDKYLSDMNTAIESARNDLMNKVKDQTFLDQIAAQGWPGAGVWYHYIAQLNETLMDGIGALPEINAPETSSMKAGANVPVGYDDWHKMTFKILEKTNQWWKTNSSKINTGRPREFAADRAYGAAAVGIDDVSLSSSDMSSYISRIFGDGDGHFLFDLNPKENIYPLGRLTQIGDSLMNWALLAFSSMAVVSAAAGLFKGSGIAIFAGPVGGLLGMIGSAVFSAAAILLWYVPMIPFIRVFFALMAWIYLVFEAVAMIPVFALMHLQTDGEGLPGSAARQGYLMLLGLLFRPILIVIGFVAALLIFNAAVPILHETLKATVSSIGGKAQIGILSMVAYSIIYVGLVYILANSTFKTIDIIPNAAMKWIGGPTEGSSDESGELVGMTAAGAGFAMNAMTNVAKSGQEGAAAYRDKKEADARPGATKGQ